MDTLTKKHRSWNLSQIRSTNTKPEIIVRKLLYSLGYRYRLHVKRLAGKPDIVLPKYKTAIFVHGCFWHRHKNCKYAYISKSRLKFWEAKFTENIKRDIKTKIELQKIGWKTIIIWECQTSKPEKMQNKLKKSLSRSAKI